MNQENEFEDDDIDIDKIDLPRIKISLEEFQHILDVEGYDMKAEDVIKQRREYLNSKKQRNGNEYNSTK